MWARLDSPTRTLLCLKAWMFKDQNDAALGLAVYASKCCREAEGQVLLKLEQGKP